MTRQKQLEQLASKYGTDKLDHGYMEHYAKHLPEECKSLLEIGVAEGKSALLWDEFYGSDKLDLHLLDLFLHPKHVNPRWCRNHNFVPHMGSQSDMNFLSQIKDTFDVIIDDGSHNSYDMWFSFKHLFINNLAPGGLYIIEDLHCCKDKHYWGTQIKGIEETPLHILTLFEQGEPIGVSRIFSPGEAEVFNSLIASVKVYDEKIVFIYKK